MLYEDPTKPMSSPNRFHIELKFSPGEKVMTPSPNFNPWENPKSTDKKDKKFTQKVSDSFSRALKIQKYIPDFTLLPKFKESSSSAKSSVKKGGNNHSSPNLEVSPSNLITSSDTNSSAQNNQHSPKIHFDQMFNQSNSDNSADISGNSIDSQDHENFKTVTENSDLKSQLENQLLTNSPDWSIKSSGSNHSSLIKSNSVQYDSPLISEKDYAEILRSSPKKSFSPQLERKNTIPKRKSPSPEGLVADFSTKTRPRSYKEKESEKMARLNFRPLSVSNNENSQSENLCDTGVFTPSQLITDPLTNPSFRKTVACSRSGHSLSALNHQNSMSENQSHSNSVSKLHPLPTKAQIESSIKKNVSSQKHKASETVHILETLHDGLTLDQLNTFFDRMIEQDTGFVNERMVSSSDKLGDDTS